MPAPLAADLLGRLATALAAGIDTRRAWTLAAGALPRRWQGVAATVTRALAGGAGLAEALAAAGDALPPLVPALAAAGERAGRDAETLRDVAETLAATGRARRAFREALVGPALRLAAALAVIGLLIALSGGLRDGAGRPLDLLGVGLVGGRGLAIYAGCLVAAAGMGIVAVPLVARSWTDRGLARTLGARLPFVGPAAGAAEAAAWCRAASLAAHAGLDAGALVTLASRAAPGLALDPERVVARLRSGAGLAEALADERRLPTAVIDAVAVGEATGGTAEALSRLAGEFDAAARRGYLSAAGGAGFAAWGIVAALVALVALRIMGLYVGMIEEAARPL